MVNTTEFTASQSPYLRADMELFQRGDIQVTITHARVENASGDDTKKDNKIIVYFAGVEKGLPVNRTNMIEFEQQCGTETDLWQGKQVVLGLARTQNPQGQSVMGIRVRPQVNPNWQAPQPAVAQTSQAAPGPSQHVPGTPQAPQVLGGPPVPAPAPVGAPAHVDPTPPPAGGGDINDDIPFAAEWR